MNMWYIASEVDLNDPYLIIFTSLHNLPLNVAGMWAYFSCTEYSKSDVMFLSRLDHKRVWLLSFSLWLYSLAWPGEANCHFVSCFMERPTCQGTALCVCVCVRVLNPGNKNESTWNAFFLSWALIWLQSWLYFDCSLWKTLSQRHPANPCLDS